MISSNEWLDYYEIYAIDNLTNEIIVNIFIYYLLVKIDQKTHF